jgi:hypothetical protein
VQGGGKVKDRKEFTEKNRESSERRKTELKPAEMMRDKMLRRLQRREEEEGFYQHIGQELSTITSQSKGGR